MMEKYSANDHKVNKDNQGKLKKNLEATESSWAFIKSSSLVCINWVLFYFFIPYQEVLT